MPNLFWNILSPIEDHQLLDFDLNKGHALSTNEVIIYLCSHPGSCATAEKWCQSPLKFNPFTSKQNFFNWYITFNNNFEQKVAKKNDIFEIYPSDNSTHHSYVSKHQLQQIDTTWYIVEKPKLGFEELTYLATFNERITPIDLDKIFFIKMSYKDGTEQIRCCYKAYKHWWARAINDQYYKMFSNNQTVKETTIDTIAGPIFKKDTLFKWMQPNKGYSIAGKEVCSFKDYSWVERSIAHKWKVLARTTNFLRSK